MTYTYRKSGGPKERADKDRDSVRNLLLHQRRKLSELSLRIGTLTAELERHVAQAIWENVPIRTVATAAGISIHKARAVGLAVESLPSSGAAMTDHLEKLGCINRQITRISNEMQILNRQHEQMLAKALKLGC